MRKRCDKMIGLSPAAWWLDMSAVERAKFPASLIAGGQEGKFGKLWLKETFLFGDNYQAEDDFNFVDIYHDKDYSKAWDRAKYGIATRTVPYLFYNTLKIQDYDEPAEKVTYSQGVVTDWKNKTVSWNGTLLRENDNIFFPLVWKDNKEIMAYSKDGYRDREWKLPQGWSDVQAVTISEVNIAGTTKPQTLKVKDGAIRLSIEPNTILSILPVR